MSLNTARSIAGRLSLREPQWESLQKLVAAIEAVPALRDHEARSPAELNSMIEALRAQFETLRL
jgi:type III restriction enzyme